MCRSYSGDPDSTAYGCNCHLIEPEERHQDKTMRCLHGRSMTEPCAMCRLLNLKGIEREERTWR